MNPLVKKEIRLLLPAWIAAMLLAIVPIWIVSLWSFIPPEETLYVPFAFAFGVLFLGIVSFGQEFSFGTFTFLLSQPMERRRIWLVKKTVLAIAFVSVLLALVVSWEFYSFKWPARAPDLLPKFGFLALFVVVFFSGGLWTTLLLRRMSEAFWLTLLTPLVIMVTLFAFSQYFHWSNRTDNCVVPAILLLYSAAGFFQARRLFLRAQDVQWTGGEISFPWRKRISERTTFSSRSRRWFSALVWKELQLHQVNILIAVVVLALDQASVVIRKVHPHFADPNVLGILELVWVLWLLLMPLLIGSAAVAEERRVGVIESQFCLPVSRRTQFLIKFFVGLILSLVLGGAMPFVIERVRDFDLWIFVVAAAIFFISFYASTVARTTLQAIGLPIVVAVAIYFYEVATAINIFTLGRYLPNKPVGLELLKLYLGIPILLFILAGLTYWNFKWLHENWKLWRRNATVVLASIASIFILTNAIYFRTWELLTSTRPPPGPARLRDSREVKFAANLNTIDAVLPDGRLWVETLAFDRATFRLAPKRTKSEFIGGSNWAAVTADDFQTLGIQSDGSLWNLQKQWNPSQTEQWQTGAFHLTRIGSETNWAQAAGGRLGFLILKKDGSLWIWGTNGYTWRDASNTIPRKLKLDLAAPPMRVGEESNWTEVFTSGVFNNQRACARENGGGILELTAEWKANYENAHLQSTNASGEWMSFASRSGAEVGVKTNGELWFSWDDWSNNKYIPGGKIQLGRNSRWRTVVFGYIGSGSVIALRNDGTLWKWPEFYTIHNIPVSVKPVQLGNHSDWITLFTCWPRTIALAADGSLWAWDEPSGHIWLAPTRKPVFLGNIFGKIN